MKTFKKTFLIASVLVLILANLPYLYGYLKVREEAQFLGLVAGVSDANQYIMMINQIRSSDGLFLGNYFSPEETQPLYFNLLWLFLGKLTWLTGLSAMAIYHGARVGAGAALLFVLHKFICYLGPEEPEQRLFAFLLICFGSGFGWLFAFFNRLSGLIILTPTDVSLPDSTLFMTLMTFPHIEMGVALSLGIYLLSFKALAKERILPSLGAGIMAWVLGFIQPFQLVSVLFILFAFVMLLTLREKGFKGRSWAPSLLIIYALSSLPLLYHINLMKFHPEFITEAHRVQLSPHPLEYLMGFGIPFFLAFLSYEGLTDLKAKSPEKLFLSAWFITNLLLLYSYPFLPFERRLVAGIEIPIGLLATHGLFGRIIPFFSGLERKNGAVPLLMGGVLIATLPTNIYHLSDRAKRLEENIHPFYLYHEEADAISYIQEQTKRDEVIMASEFSGNILASQALRRVFIGHWAMTPHVEAKRRMLSIFFDSRTPDALRMSIIEDYSISILYYGLEERKLGNFNPDRATFLRKVFENSMVKIYRVV